jgi:hypothetical protein
MLIASICASDTCVTLLWKLSFVRGAPIGSMHFSCWRESEHRPFIRREERRALM